MNWWNNFVLLLAIFNSFAVPVEMTVYEKLTEVKWYYATDVIINILFIIDIIVQFNTSFYNQEGEEIRDRKEIATRYMFKGMFIFDFLSSIPYDAFNLDSFKVLKILKITRISRMTKAINKMELKEENKAVSAVQFLT